MGRKYYLLTIESVYEQILKPLIKSRIHKTHSAIGTIVEDVRRPYVCNLWLCRLHTHNVTSVLAAGHKEGFDTIL